MAFRRYRAFRKYGVRSSFNWARKKYVTRQNAIASTPYIAGAAIGFTGIVDSYIPPRFQNILMIAAVAPAGLMKGKLSMLKSVAQGYIIGRVVKGVVGFNGINVASGTSGGPWL